MTSARLRRCKVCPLLLECVHAAELAPLAKRRLPQKVGGVLLTVGQIKKREREERRRRDSRDMYRLEGTGDERPRRTERSRAARRARLGLRMAARPDFCALRTLVSYRSPNISEMHAKTDALEQASPASSAAGKSRTGQHTTHSTPASDRPATAHMTLTAHAHSTIHANSWPMTHASMQRGYPSATISLHAIGASLHRVSSSHASASRTVRERAILSSASAESSSCGSAASLQRVSAAELWTKLIDSSVS